MRVPRPRDLFAGPHPALPRPLDAAAEQWARLRPRIRLLIAATAVVTLAAAVHVRVSAADARWGGPALTVLVAAEDTPVGAAPELRTISLPPAAVPPRAVLGTPPEAVLSMPLPEGAILTENHLAERGPAAALPAGFRGVPVPVEEGWAVTAGGWVDVWVLGGGEPAALAARSRPVLALREEGPGLTALVGLNGDDEVERVTNGLAVGRVLLTHAPAPGG